MWRSYHNIRVYLFSYCFLIHQIASRNGFAIPLSRPVPARPWKLTNSSFSSTKQLPNILNGPYPNCGSVSSTSNVKTDKYVTDDKKYFRGSTNYKTVRLNNTEPISIKSKTWNTLPLSNESGSTNKTVRLNNTEPISIKSKTWNTLPLSNESGATNKTIRLNNTEPISIKSKTWNTLPLSNESGSTNKTLRLNNTEPISIKSKTWNTLPLSNESGSTNKTVRLNNTEPISIKSKTWNTLPLSNKSGSTNYKRVRLNNTEPISIKSKTWNTLHLSNETVSRPPPQTSPITPKQSKWPVGSSYKQMKNPSSNSSFTKIISSPYGPMLTTRFDSSTPLIKNIPISNSRPATAFCGRNEQELLWNSLDTKVKSPTLSDMSGSSIRMETLSKPVINLIGNPVSYAPCETINEFTGSKINDITFKLFPPQVCPSGFILSPLSQYASPLNFVSDPIAPLLFVNSGLNSASLERNINFPFTSNNIETSSCNPYLPSPNLLRLTDTNDSIQTVSRPTPVPNAISCSNNDFSTDRPKFKVKSMELKILPMPFLTDNSVQGMVKPLIKNKTVPCFSENNNIEANSQILTNPTIKLEDQPLLDAFETLTINNGVINDAYLSDTVDPELSSHNANSQLASSKFTFSIPSLPVLLNTLSPSASVSPLIEIGHIQSMPPSPILDSSEVTILENSSLPLPETLLPQIVCVNESTSITSVVESEENGISHKVCSEQREIDPKCISDIPTDHTFFPMISTDSDSLIEKSNATNLQVCNASILETLVDDFSSSEVPLLGIGQLLKSDFNISEQYLSNLLPSYEAPSSLNPIQPSVSEMYIPPDNSPHVVQMTSEQNDPRFEILDYVPLSIIDILRMSNYSSLSSQYLNQSLYPSIYDINYFYTDSPILQVSPNSLAPVFKFPNDFLYETIDILPFEQTLIHDNNILPIPLIDISNSILNVSVPIGTLPSNTFFSDVDVVLLPYTEYQSNLDDNLKTDEISSTFLVPCTIIDSTYIPNTSSSPIYYDVTPYLVSHETFVPNMLTPASYLLDYQSNNPDVIIEPIYFVQEDFNSYDYAGSSLVLLPDNLDSFFSLSAITGGDLFNDSVPKSVIENNFSEVVNNKIFISEINDMVEALPIINYVLLSSASEKLPDVSIYNDELVNTVLCFLSNEKIPSVEKLTAVSLPCVQSNSENKCNRKSTSAKSWLDNTKRQSRNTSSKSKSDVLLESVSENITGTGKLPNSESLVTVPDMPYSVSLLQHSLDALSSMEFDDCALYNTVNLGSTTPLPKSDGIEKYFELMSANHSETSKFVQYDFKLSSAIKLTSLDKALFNDGFSDIEEIAIYIVLKELLNSDSTSNWDLLGKIIDLLCSDNK